MAHPPPPPRSQTTRLSPTWVPLLDIEEEITITKWHLWMACHWHRDTPNVDTGKVTGTPLARGSCGRWRCSTGGTPQTKAYKGLGCPPVWDSLKRTHMHTAMRCGSEHTTKNNLRPFFSGTEAEPYPSSWTL